MAKEFRVGIIGSGGIAQNAHFPGWAALEDRGAKVVALADVNRKTARTAAEKFNVPGVYTDYRKMLRSEKLDAVSICTPAALHCEQAVAALKRRLHVLCEKPVCLSTAECRRISAAARKSRRVFMTGQHLRFTGDSVALKQYMEGSPLGEIYYVHCRALRRRGLPARPTFTSKKLSGGGPLLDIGVHILDLAWWLMGGPRPVAVSGFTSDRLIARGGKLWNAWGDWSPRKTDVEDFACGLIRFENDAVMYLESSFLLNLKERSVFTAQICGTEAGVLWPDCEIFGEKKKQLTDTKIFNIPKLKAHNEEVRAFYEAAVGRKKSPVPIAESSQVIAILEALYASADRGREVRIRR
ncbi:MAG: Gfo/Idh/MocA family protein [Planctomycetota bacterium]|jgi:predicted dehydrogenase